MGASNADGHELDFATENASRQVARWAYLYDAAARQVTAYAYAATGAPVAGETFAGLAAFACETHEITDLRLPSSDVYDPLFAAASAAPVDFDYGWSPSQAVGGNHIVRVGIAAPGTNAILLLASATAPSSFTVVVRYTPPPATPAP